MTQPAPTETATPTATPSLEERTAAALAEMGPSEPAGDALTSADPPPAEAMPSAASPADSGDPTAAARAAERRQRLDDLRNRERERVDRKAQQTQADRLAQELAQAQRRAEEAEQAANARLDRGLLKDPARLIRLLESEGVPPTQVADAIREAITNPAGGAAREVREAISPELAALRQQNEQLAQRLEAFERQQLEAQAAETERQQTSAFLGFVSQSSERAPLSARLLEADPDEFLQIASIAAERVSGMGAEALLDQVEDMLDSDARKVAQTYARLYGMQPSQAPAPVQPPRAAAQANTVSNSLAQGRSAIVEDEDFAKLPLEERAARLIRSM